VALTGKQRRHLRALGHALKPVVQVGRAGISDAVVAACVAALGEHELVKVKLGAECAVERDNAATQLAGGTGAEVAQILGRTLLLYLARPAEDERERIRLPE
jgi:RNA-binding protein